MSHGQSIKAITILFQDHPSQVIHQTIEMSLTPRPIQGKCEGLIAAKEDGELNSKERQNLAETELEAELEDLGVWKSILE